MFCLGQWTKETEAGSSFFLLQLHAVQTGLKGYIQEAGSHFFFVCRWEMASLLLCLHSTFVVVVYNSFILLYLGGLSGSCPAAAAEEREKMERRVCA